MTLARNNLATLYDRDYALWLSVTIEQLRDRDYDNKAMIVGLLSS